MNEQTLSAMLATLTPEIVASFRTAVEIGKWADGRRLTAEQRETCMQAVLAWEIRYMPENQRTGYIDKGSKSDGEVCESHDHDEEKPLIIR